MSSNERYGDTAGVPALLDDRGLEALLAGRTVEGYDDVAEAVTLLACAGRGAPPAPSAELAQLLLDGFDPLPAPLTARTRAGDGRRRRWALRALAAAAAVGASTLTAATANALPPAVQDVVADVVTALSPFELPRTAQVADRGAADDTEVGDGRTAPADGSAGRSRSGTVEGEPAGEPAVSPGEAVTEVPRPFDGDVEQRRDERAERPAEAARETADGGRASDRPRAAEQPDERDDDVPQQRPERDDAREPPQSEDREPLAPAPPPDADTEDDRDPEPEPDRDPEPEPAPEPDPEPDPEADEAPVPELGRGPDAGGDGVHDESPATGD